MVIRFRLVYVYADVIKSLTINHTVGIKYRIGSGSAFLPKAYFTRKKPHECTDLRFNPNPLLSNSKCYRMSASLLLIYEHDVCRGYPMCPVGCYIEACHPKSGYLDLEISRNVIIWSISNKVAFKSKRYN